MKKILLSALVVGLTLSVPTNDIFAQQGKSPQNVQKPTLKSYKKGNKAMKPQSKSAEERANILTERMDKAANFSKEQRAQVYKLNLINVRKKMDFQASKKATKRAVTEALTPEQQKTWREKGRTRPPVDAKRKDINTKAQELTDKLAADLDLKKKQKAQIHKINTQFLQQQENTQVEREQLRKEGRRDEVLALTKTMRESQTNRQNAIAKVLTPEQRTKWESTRLERPSKNNDDASPQELAARDTERMKDVLKLKNDQYKAIYSAKLEGYKVEQAFKIHTEQNQAVLNKILSPEQQKALNVKMRHAPRGRNGSNGHNPGGMPRPANQKIK